MGLLSEPRITRIAQMGYDAPRPFVLGFWVPACAGMMGVGEFFCLNRGLRRWRGWARMPRALLSPGSGFPPARE